MTQLTSPVVCALILCCVIEIASAQRYGQLRLVNGRNNYSGRVEIYWAGRWGTICDDGFDNKAASVVCRELGLPFSNAQPYWNAQFGRGRGRILLDEVNCQGNEERLILCRHNDWGWNDCSHSEDVGVDCDLYMILPGPSESSWYTSTPQPTESSWYTSTPQPTESSWYTSTLQPTESSWYTSTPQPSESSWYRSTPQPTESSWYTSTPQPTESSWYTSTLQPTESSPYTPTPEPTDSSQYTPTPEPTESSQYTPTPEPTESSQYTPTSEPTESSPFTPTLEPTESSQYTPTPEPTESAEISSSTTESTRVTALYEDIQASRPWEQQYQSME